MIGELSTLISKISESKVESLSGDADPGIGPDLYLPSNVGTRYRLEGDTVDGVLKGLVNKESWRNRIVCWLWTSLRFASLSGHEGN